MAETGSSKWVELSIEAPAEYVEPLGHLFRRYGKGGVVTEEPGGYSPDEGESPPVADRVTVKTFYPLDEEADARFGRIDVGVRLMSQLACMSPLMQRVIEERDWADAWKEHFHPLRVGRRLGGRALVAGIRAGQGRRRHKARPGDGVRHGAPSDDSHVPGAGRGAGGAGHGGGWTPAAGRGSSRSRRRCWVRAAPSGWTWRSRRCRWRGRTRRRMGSPAW